MLRDARSFLLSEGASEALRIYVGARAADEALVNFLTEVAGGDETVAVQFVETRGAITRADSRNGASNGEWSTYLTGRLWHRALLSAAASPPNGENTATPGVHAERWERERADLVQRAERRAGADDRGAVSSRIASIARDIGDIDQGDARLATEVDELLRVDRQFGAAAGPTRHTCSYEAVFVESN